jgi:GTP-binding protein Era
MSESAPADQPDPPVPPDELGFRSGFCCFVGRPNAGKSTLTNVMVGSKIVITSEKPQTTRHAVRGIVNREHAQLILVDTPGLHRPRTLLGQRLNDVVHATLSEVDVVGFCLPANEKIGPGDRFIAAELAKLKVPVIAVITKTDLATPEQTIAALQGAGDLGDYVEIVPVSARNGDQVELLVDLMIAQLPEGPQFYPDDIATDESSEGRIAELIREAALEGVRDELPHSIAVTIQEMHPRAERPDITEIFATLHIERPSQKAIVLGAKGARLKHIGTVAREQIEALLGQRVYLDLHVSVMPEWQRDPKKLDRLGF